MAEPVDNQEWQAIFDAYGPKLLLFARQQTSDPGEAEDIVQEAFVRFWKQRQRHGEMPVEMMFRWIKQIAIDFARRHRRRRSREERVQESDGSSDWFVPESEVEDRERREQVTRALEGLSKDQREVVVLRIWGDMTFDQVATTLGISPNTAASRYRYALGHVKRALAGYICNE